MNFTNSLSMALLAIYLILTGLISVTGIQLGQASNLMPVLAIAAGVFILAGK